MRRKRHHEQQIRQSRGGRWAFVACALFLLAALLPARVTPALAQRADALVLIIGSSSPITDLPADVVRSAFLGLRAEHQGVRLIPFNLPLHTPLRERLDRILLGLEPSEVGSFWVDQKVRDGRSPPRTAPSVELTVRLVAQLPGAIAGVPTSALDPHVRALRIDGKEPSNKGYLLTRE